MITLYEKTATDYTGNGLCGLSPISCVVRETAGGSYELEMKHPMDDNGKYQLLTEERLIKAPVPKTVVPETELPALYTWKVVNETTMYGMLPQIQYDETTWEQFNDIYDDWYGYQWDENEEYSAGDLVIANNWQQDPYSLTPYYIYKAKSTTTGSNPAVDLQHHFWEPVVAYNTLKEQVLRVRSMIITTLAIDTKLYKIADAGADEIGAYSRIKTENNVIGLVLSEDITIDQGHQNQILPQQTITEQVFRIYSISSDESSQTVTVKARHISYDFMANSLYTCMVCDAKPLEAIVAIQSSLAEMDVREIATNISAGYITQDWSFKNPINALLDPDTGLLGMLNAKLIRNNGSFYLFENTPQNGITIAYGVNMIGVKWDKSIEQAVTRVIPRSGTEGDYIYIDNGGKISNGVVQDQGKMYVESADSANYAIQRYQVLNCSVKIGDTYTNPDGTTGKYTDGQVRAKMLEEAANVFLKDHADQPVYSLDVQFILLGDTEEYSQYRGLQTVNLYDTVTIKTGKIGATATAQVVEYEFDSIAKRYNRIKVGSVNLKQQRTPGYRLVTESITATKLAPELINRINKAKDNAVLNSSIEDGMVKRGGSNPSMVWKTDQYGVPDWRPEASGINVIDNLTSTSATDALSAKQGKVLDEKIAIKSYEEYTFSSITFEAGTIGTRGLQQTYTPSKTPVAYSITNISDSSKIIPIIFIYNGKVYLNSYRASSSAVSNLSVKVRIYFDS